MKVGGSHRDAGGRVTWKRPGRVASSRPLMMDVAVDCSRAPESRKAKIAVTAVAAFWSWCAPASDMLTPACRHFDELFKSRSGEGTISILHKKLNLI